MCNYCSDLLLSILLSPVFIASVILVVIVKILIDNNMEIGYGRVLNAVESSASALTASCKSVTLVCKT